MEGVIGEIRGFGGNFAPRAWAFCQGQLLSIAQNTALFSILGTTYGGDGRTTFALPDLRGRAPISAGTGPGLSTHKLGARSGTETVTLNVLQIPSHFHAAIPSGVGTADLHVSDLDGTSGTPVANGSIGNEVGGTAFFYNDDTAPDVKLAQASITNVQTSVSIAPTGGSQPHNNMQPYLTIYWIICLQGVFPSRS